MDNQINLPKALLRRLWWQRSIFRKVLYGSLNILVRFFFYGGLIGFAQCIVIVSSALVFALCAHIFAVVSSQALCILLIILIACITIPIIIGFIILVIRVLCYMNSGILKIFSLDEPCSLNSGPHKEKLVSDLIKKFETLHEKTTDPIFFIFANMSPQWAMFYIKRIIQKASNPYTIAMIENAMYNEFLGHYFSQWTPDENLRDNLRDDLKKAVSLLICEMGHENLISVQIIANLFELLLHIYYNLGRSKSYVKEVSFCDIAKRFLSYPKYIKEAFLEKLKLKSHDFDSFMHQQILPNFYFSKENKAEKFILEEIIFEFQWQDIIIQKWNLHCQLIDPSFYEKVCNYTEIPYSNSEQLAHQLIELQSIILGITKEVKEKKRGNKILKPLEEISIFSKLIKELENKKEKHISFLELSSYLSKVEETKESFLNPEEKAKIRSDLKDLFFDGEEEKMSDGLKKNKDSLIEKLSKRMDYKKKLYHSQCINFYYEKIVCVFPALHMKYMNTLIFPEEKNNNIDIAPNKQLGSFEKESRFFLKKLKNLEENKKINKGYLLWKKTVVILKAREQASKIVYGYCRELTQEKNINFSVEDIILGYFPVLDISNIGFLKLDFETKPIMKMLKSIALNDYSIRDKKVVKENYIPVSLDEKKDERLETRLD